MSPHIRRKDLALAHHGCQKTACGDDRRRSNGGGGRWLKGAKEAKEAKKAKKAKTQKAYKGHTKPRVTEPSKL
jgi:hypothetical protein